MGGEFVERLLSLVPKAGLNHAGVAWGSLVSSILVFHSVARFYMFCGVT